MRRRLSVVLMFVSLLALQLHGSVLGLGSLRRKHVSGRLPAVQRLDVHSVLFGGDEHLCFGLPVQRAVLRGRPRSMSLGLELQRYHGPVLRLSLEHDCLRPDALLQQLPVLLGCVEEPVLDVAVGESVGSSLPRSVDCEAVSLDCTALISPESSAVGSAYWTDASSKLR